MALSDIPTSIVFWSGIATLGSAAGAWFTFVAAAHSSRRNGIRNLLVGIKAELDFVKEWASGGEGSSGHLPADNPTLAKEHPEWSNPSRFIFAFETATLPNLTLSPYVGHLTS